MVLIVSVSNAKGEVEELCRSTLDPSNEFHPFLISSNIPKAALSRHHLLLILIMPDLHRKPLCFTPNMPL